MKRWLAGLGVIAFIAFVVWVDSRDGGLYALGGAPVNDVGATSTGTVTCVRVTTTPAIILSTGQMPLGTPDFIVDSGFRGSTSAYYFQQSTMTYPGTHMLNRLYLEILNDSDVDIFVGYDSNVSSITDSQYKGRRIAAGQAWTHNCSIVNHWAVAGSSTGRNIVISQER